MTTGASADLARAAVAGQLRPAIDGNAPPLIVAQMQVENVHLVVREQVHEALDGLDVEEVSGQVQHRPPPGEAGTVAHGAGDYGPGPGLQPRSLDGGRQELADGL